MTKVIDLTQKENQSYIMFKFNNKLGYNKNAVQNQRIFDKLREIDKNAVRVRTREIENRFNVDLSLMDSDY